MAVTLTEQVGMQVGYCKLINLSNIQKFVYGITVCNYGCKLQVASCNVGHPRFGPVEYRTHAGPNITYEILSFWVFLW